MTVKLSRVVGSAVTAGAVVAFLLLYGGAAERLEAAPRACCQECNAQEAACYSACNAQSHDGGYDDSLNSCLSTCNADVLGCWSACIWCETTPTAPCYAYSSGHVTISQNGSWKVLHDVDMWEVGSGMCPF